MILADLMRAASNRIFTTPQAEAYVGGGANLRKLRAAGWLKPWKEVHADVQYDVRDLDAAIDQVKRDGWPKGKTTNGK